jgi:hypothetical protein
MRLTTWYREGFLITGITTKEYMESGTKVERVKVLKERQKLEIETLKKNNNGINYFSINC